MEKSKNWGFNLPNSANDEIADINTISDNFRTIDRVMNETEQTFEPESTKAASGKAVKEAIDGVQPIDENTEFIFDGGNADGAVAVDIVIDTALSRTSTNAIQNKAVAAKTDELANKITQVKSDLTDDIESAKTELTADINAVVLSVYPVGAIYISANSVNPGTLFGGTWEQIKDMFLLAAGDTYTAGDTGGEATHTLTVSEMPAHSHGVTNVNDKDVVTSGTEGTSNRFTFASGATDTINFKTVTDTGGGLAHNNMPPYIAVYVWKRTA